MLPGHACQRRENKSKGKVQKAKAKTGQTTIPLPVRCHPELCEESRLARLCALGSCLFPVTRHSSFVTRVSNNPISFHQHNGKTTLSCLFFNNIMARPKTDNFSTFVLNNIWHYPSFFPPALFCQPPTSNLITNLFSTRYIFRRVSGSIVNSFCFPIHHGKRRTLCRCVPRSGAWGLDIFPGARILGS